jgi:hypothetical protein
MGNVHDIRISLPPPLPLGFDQYNSEHIKARVQAFFPDLPVMVAIADCESEFRQFDYDTSLLRGGGGTVVGIFQINEAIHRPLALTLGLDISSIDGNILYARHMYEEDGIYPWLSSFPCWNPKIHPTATSTASENPAALLTKDFHLGVVNPEVLVLQQILNHNGFPIADSGPGSPGNETTSYGIRTRNAVRLFQCTKLNICSGDESTTGYGFFNQPTRRALLALVASNQPSTTPVLTPEEQKAKLIKDLQNQIALLIEQVTILLKKEIAKKGGQANI